jgi:septum formation protein
MAARTLVLASASSARLRVLRDAGLDPKVVVTGVPEDDVLETSAAEIVGVLARRKALAVDVANALVIGCDSLLELDGVAMGKPASNDEARHRWRQMRGKRGTLYTGHCVVDTATGAQAMAVAGTDVEFGTPTEREIDAYIATGEPLRVAGAFTLDGFAAPFVTRIEGDHGTVLGLSMPLLRELLQQLGVEVTDLWC